MAALRVAAQRTEAQRLAGAASKRRTATPRYSPACSLKAAVSPAWSTRTASTSKPLTAGTIVRCRSRTARRARPSLPNWEPSRPRNVRVARSPCCSVLGCSCPRRGAWQTCANSARSSGLGPRPATGLEGPGARSPVYGRARRPRSEVKNGEQPTWELLRLSPFLFRPSCRRRGAGACWCRAHACAGGSCRASLPRARRDR